MQGENVETKKLAPSPVDEWHTFVRIYEFFEQLDGSEPRRFQRTVHDHRTQLYHCFLRDRAGVLSKDNRTHKSSELLNDLRRLASFRPL